MRVCSFLGNRDKTHLTFLSALLPLDPHDLHFYLQWPDFSEEGEKQLHSGFVCT